MKHPIVKQMTYLKVDELGKSEKFPIVNSIIADAIEANFLPKCTQKQIDFIHGLINLGWDLADLKKNGFITNNGKNGDKCIWSIN